MKLFNNKVVLFFIIFMCIGDIMFSQSEVGTNKVIPRNILEALSSRDFGDGLVTIHQPVFLRDILTSSNVSSVGLLFNDDTDFISQKGYRIQIYNGNLPKSKVEAYDRAKKIEMMYSDIPCYITYKAPFWRLLVGDFSTKDEAISYMDQLKNTFPEYKKEIYIVSSYIRIQKDTNVQPLNN